MQIKLTGKRALVTGGTRGIGRACVRALAEAGADVVVCHRQGGEPVETLSRELRLTGGDHRFVQADVSRPDDVARLIGECGPHLDILVNNAGVISHVPFHELSLEEWQRIVDTNLTAAFAVTQRALPLLTGGSSVVFVGSKVATVGMPLRAHYTASKAGLVGLSRTLCKELGPRGIRVNVVQPGIIQTMDIPADRLKHYEAIVSLGRLGRPEEIANVVTFLASDLAAYITGETLNVDGGT
ncbi:SDR family oxidoreductase [Microbispora sp. RL4-1S]|uniref:SDR family oxidoreductase n=1 Tax=Microbispora oryzae TaxID=2806554 RepID=A0A941AMD4_9ACTN|nr:SDR family NAD(P)-dependent oxidoreductase [Microbispora oryzae]MBP2708282.1 SDR family oxidoreductase [Microbispora oryzae]